MRLLTLLLVLAGIVYPHESRASDPGVAVRACQVMSEPFQDARLVTSLKEGDTVKILKRKGGWLNISTQGKTGWVRMLFIRRGEAGAQASAIKEATGVLGLATGRAGSGNVVASTGVRGLDEEDLKQAEFNETEWQTLQTYGVSKKDARMFANQAGLKTQTVPFIQPADGN
jgi:predicted PhzF superfamily epimerase YddE/YHI9